MPSIWTALVYHTQRMQWVTGLHGYVLYINNGYSPWTENIHHEGSMNESTHTLVSTNLYSEHKPGVYTNINM